jgi:hypothetical protein
MTAPTRGPANTAKAQASGPDDIVFIDKGIADYQALVDGVSNGVEVVLLETDQDGPAQMVAALEGRTGLDGIHVLSHGTTGAVQLGDTWLSTETLDTHRDALATLGDALSSQGDLLLYGCNVASDRTGEAFIENLAALTGADVAASENLTGSVHLGGDETLEIHTGTVEADYILSTSSEYLLSPGSLLNFDTGTVPDNHPNNFVHNGFTLAATTDAEIGPPDPVNKNTHCLQSVLARC